MCVEQAFTRSINIECVICKQKGSSLLCFYQRCSNTYHFTCANDNDCVFIRIKYAKKISKHKDNIFLFLPKTIMCPIHASKTIANDEILEDKSVFRNVWMNRDEIKQIQK